MWCNSKRLQTGTVMSRLLFSTFGSSVSGHRIWETIFGLGTTPQNNLVGLLSKTRCITTCGVYVGAGRGFAHAAEIAGCRGMRFLIWKSIT